MFRHDRIGCIKSEDTTAHNQIGPFASKQTDFNVADAGNPDFSAGELELHQGHDDATSRTARPIDAAKERLQWLVKVSFDVLASGL